MDALRIHPDVGTGQLVSALRGESAAGKLSEAEQRYVMDGALTNMIDPHADPDRRRTNYAAIQSLRDASCSCIPHDLPFPVALDPFTCNRFEIAEFAKEAYAVGARYIGLCCGAMPHHVRSVAEALGRRPSASRYSADMSKHAYFGNDASLKQSNRDYAQKL